jgi:hypothetical protein
MRIMKIIKERGAVHGDINDNALNSQTFKIAARSMTNWRHGKLSPVQRECIEMILLKIGRIGSGDPNFRDHWDDIAGYAELAANQINSRESE